MGDMYKNELLFFFRFRGVLSRKCREKIDSIVIFFQEFAKRLCHRKSAADNQPAQNGGGYPFPVTGPGILTRNSTRQLVPGRDDFVRHPRGSRNGLNFRKEGIPENQRTLLPEPNHRNITRLWNVKDCRNFCQNFCQYVSWTVKNIELIEGVMKTLVKMEVDSIESIDGQLLRSTVDH